MNNDDSPKNGDPLEGLAQHRASAPPGFAQRVMQRLPQAEPSRGWQGLVPYPAWLKPALAGSLAALLLVLWFSRSGPMEGDPVSSEPARIVIRFELHAPDVRHVELVGDFNAWQPGQIQLQGPDTEGYWMAEVELSEGRYEYLFLVDGQQWMPDPGADIYRADGFGNKNAVLLL